MLSYGDKRYVHKPEYPQENEMHKSLWDWHMNRSPNLRQKTDFVLIKENFPRINSAVGNVFFYSNSNYLQLFIFPVSA